MISWRTRQKKNSHNCTEILPSSRTLFFHLKYLIYSLRLKEKGIVAWLFPTRNHHLGSNFDIYKIYFKPSRLLQYWIVFWKWSLLESWECVQHQSCYWSITCFIFCLGHCDNATRLQDQPPRMLGNCSDHAQEDDSSSWALPYVGFFFKHLFILIGG